MNATFGWVTRDAPLAPAAVWLPGSLQVEPAPGLTGVRTHTGDWLLLGPAAQLPWSEGALYLGREPDEPFLLAPTWMRPEWPASWLVELLRSRCPPPWALLPDRSVVGLALAAALDAPP